MELHEIEVGRTYRVNDTNRGLELLAGAMAIPYRITPDHLSPLLCRVTSTRWEGDRVYVLKPSELSPLRMRR